VTNSNLSASSMFKIIFSVKGFGESSGSNSYSVAPLRIVYCYKHVLTEIKKISNNKSFFFINRNYNNPLYNNLLWLLFLISFNQMSSVLEKGIHTVVVLPRYCLNKILWKYIMKAMKERLQRNFNIDFIIIQFFFFCVFHTKS
jgi:uncharacterized protein YukJ